MNRAILERLEKYEMNGYPNWLLATYAYQALTRSSNDIKHLDKAQDSSSSTILQVGIQDKDKEEYLTNSNIKKARNALNTICLKKGISAKKGGFLIKKQSNLHGIHDRKRDMLAATKYVSYPITHNLDRVKTSMADAITNSKMAVSGLDKLQYSIYTKIKDKPQHEDMYKRVVTWRCPFNKCEKSFIAMILNLSLRDTIDNIIKFKNGPLCDHYLSSHAICSPNYPTCIIHTISKKLEQTESKLGIRVNIELAKNPNLLLVTSKPTTSVPHSIIEAIKKVHEIV